MDLRIEMDVSRESLEETNHILREILEEVRAIKAEVKPKPAPGIGLFILGTPVPQ